MINETLEVILEHSLRGAGIGHDAGVIGGALGFAGKDLLAILPLLGYPAVKIMKVLGLDGGIDFRDGFVDEYRQLVGLGMGW